MQALYATKNENGNADLKLTERPIPNTTTNTVLVKIHAASLNPSDVLNASGGFNHTVFPRIPGRDYAGTVKSGPADLIGKDVYGTSGDLLGFSADGTHAQYCLVPIDSVAPKPSNLTFAQAATVGVPFTTAALALRRSNVKAGETVLVIGSSGAVGSAACQLAEQWGCRVLTAARRPRADINLVEDPKMTNARKLTKGKGPDVVIDTVGSPNLMSAALAILAQRGRLSYISAPRTGSTELTFDMKALYREEKSIVGSNSVLTPSKDTAAELRLMTPEFESGKLHVEKEEDLVLVGIKDAVEAYGNLKNAHGKKYVIVF